jgi:CMP-N,N'-diacetyllegionaminic acid synthase
VTVLAVIPARGGSKGLPRKNVLPLAGVPLVGHALRCAASVPAIDRTVVSTDDDEIAAVAAQFGGEVVRRPAELAADETPTWPVLRHALDAAGGDPELLVLLEPTDPLRLPGDVDAAIELARANPDADGVVAVSEPPFNPFFQGVEIVGGRMRPLFPHARLERRQDAPQSYYVNGCVYVWRTGFVRSHDGHWLDGDTVPLVTPAARAVSVDTADDLALCEALLASGRVSLPWL